MLSVLYYYSCNRPQELFWVSSYCKGKGIDKRSSMHHRLAPGVIFIVHRPDMGPREGEALYSVWIAGVGISLQIADFRTLSICCVN